MKKSSNVVLANGFEEIEALTIVDVLRRAGIDCDLIGMEETVSGSHQNHSGSRPLLEWGPVGL